MAAHPKNAADPWLVLARRLIRKRKQRTPGARLGIYITSLGAAEGRLMPPVPPPAFTYTPPGHVLVTAAQGPVEVVIRVEDLCWANCDRSGVVPVVNNADFTCFLQKYAAGDPWANCDQSTTPPVLNVADFNCFLRVVATGCVADRMIARTEPAPWPAPVRVDHGVLMGEWMEEEGGAGLFYRAILWPDTAGVLEIDTGRMQARGTGHFCLWTYQPPGWPLPPDSFDYGFLLPGFVDPTIGRVPPPPASIEAPALRMAAAPLKENLASAPEIEREAAEPFKVLDDGRVTPRWWVLPLAAVLALAWGGCVLMFIAWWTWRKKGPRR